MEYIPGGNLYKVMQKNGRKFNEEQACFILAEVILGFEYLHKVLHVIYADLKPENILLSRNGHIKITDFGLSKHFNDENEVFKERIGTHEYMAPEIISKRGFNKNIDFWCLGIFLYELLNGKTPFFDS